jgi:hypothetical protein
MQARRSIAGRQVDLGQQHQVRGATGAHEFRRLEGTLRDKHVKGCLGVAPRELHLGNSTM